MIIDVNAYLGHFAFRRLRHNTAADLLRLMDSKKIDKAVVSSASAITYRNPQAGNEDLAAEIRRHRDRLIPFAVINPSYAGWQDDLKICRDDFGILRRGNGHGRRRAVASEIDGDRARRRVSVLIVDGDGERVDA